VTFDARSSSDPEGDTLTYLWNVGTGAPQSGPFAVRRYADEGSYDVTLIASDQQGASDTTTTRISVENAAPDLDTVVTPAGTIRVGTSTTVRVSAHDLGSADSLTMQIDWKDGDTSTLYSDHASQEVSLAHTYSNLGTYWVEVTVRDNDGGVTRRTGDPPIRVVSPQTDGGPTARIVISSGLIAEGTEVTFDGSTSSDPDGDSLTFVWSFGDSVWTLRDSEWILEAATGSGAVTTHVYRKNGSHPVSLIVRSHHGAADTLDLQLYVANAPPLVREILVPNHDLMPGSPFRVEMYVYDHGYGDALTAVVDWGDGAKTEIDLAGWWYATALHAYADTGDYLVKVTIRDNDGGATTQPAPHAIRVRRSSTNRPPVARIIGPITIGEGFLSTFSGRESSDPDGDPLRYDWTFAGFQHWSQDTLVESPRVYDENGSYTITLMVTDTAGGADTSSVTLTVHNASPRIDLVQATTQQAVGVSAALHAAFWDPGTRDTHVMRVQWGDGTSDSLPARARSLPQWSPDSAMHAYATPGKYSVTVTVRDDDGGVATATLAHPIVVFNPDERQTIAGYEASDLGTLGGNSAQPADINDRGQIVGSSLTASGFTHAFQFENAEMRDLGTIGHNGSEALRINEAGVIAGRVWQSSQPYDGDGTRIGAIWRNGTGTVLDSIKPRPPLFLIAINGQGDVAWNECRLSIDEPCWGWLSRNGAWQALRPSGREAYVAAMNDRGQVVGIVPISYAVLHAFVWEADSLRDLGVLGSYNCNSSTSGCSWSRALDINESGQIVGVSSDSGGHYHFVTWENGMIRDLGAIPHDYWASSARAFINERGQIAAWADGEGFFWSGDNRRSFGSLGGSLEIVGMNDNGEVVGTVRVGAEQHVFVWSESRGLVDLGTGPHGFNAAWAVDINSRGDILGYAAPCDLSFYSGSRVCGTHAQGRPQVRAILWRNTQAAASR